MKKSNVFLSILILVISACGGSNSSGSKDPAKRAVKNVDEILSVENLNGVYIGPADMSLAFGLTPKFDIKEDPVFSNIKLIVQKAKEYGKIAGIHNGTTQYAKEMIALGYQFVTISSDYRGMTSFAQNIVKEMKEIEQDKENSTYWIFKSYIQLQLKS